VVRQHPELDPRAVALAYSCAEQRLRGVPVVVAARLITNLLAGDPSVEPFADAPRHQRRFNL
jgi:hypothetical protein